MAGSGSIYKLMAAILADVSPVAKGRQNTQQNYKFRGIDQIAEMMHPLLAKHGVVMLPRVVEQQRHEYETRNGGTMHVAILTIDWHFIAPDGSEVVSRTVGEGADSGDKATNKAMTASQKYAITLAFCVPYEGQEDGDGDSPEPRAQTQRQTAARSPQKQGADAGKPSRENGDAASPSLPAGWYDERIGFGKYKDRTWRELVVGGEGNSPAEPGGGRWGWLEYMVEQLDKPQKTQRDEGILARVRKAMDAINKRADTAAGGGE